MNTREYLSQLKNIDKRIRDKIEESERWYGIATGTGYTLKEINVQTSKKFDKMEDAVIMAMQYEEESRELSVYLTKLKHHIIGQIDGMTNETYYNVLKDYYVRDMTIKDIARKQNYSTKQMGRIFDKAVDDFERMYYENYKDLIKRCP